MQVLWLTPDKPADISVGRRRIASHLASEGFDVELVGVDPTALPHIYRDIGQYDAVVGTTRSGAIVGGAVASAADVPFVVDHVDPIRQLAETVSWPAASVVERLENLAFSRSDHTLYVYAEERPRVESHAPRTTHTSLGVDFDRFADPADHVLEAARDRLSESDLRSNVALYVGGLEPIYHVRELLEGVEHLDDWSLVVLGAGSMADEVSAAASDSSAVVHVGTVPHERVPGYLHAADVGVSLVDDPHTLKVLEYGASRLPTVQLAGRATSVFDGLVQLCRAEPRSIADAIERARDMDGATVDEFQAFAETYRWERIAGDYSEALLDLSSAREEALDADTPLVR